MNQKLKKIACCILAASSMAGSAMAANAFYEQGDLILFFQEETGINTLYVNLGNTATEFRGAATGPDATNKINFLDISSSLSSTFGAGWANRTDLYAGLAGAWGNGLDSLLQNGDPQRTLYVSAARGTLQPVGTADSGGYTVVTNTGMTSAAGGIIGMGGPFEANGTTGIYPAIKDISTIDNQNPFAGAGLQDTAFSTFVNGVQQAGTNGIWGDLDLNDLGEIEDIEFALDLYRIQARNNLPGQVGFGETIREGTFEGTVVLTSNGSVSFVTAPEPSSAALAGIAGAGLLLRRRRRAN